MANTNYWLYNLEESLAKVTDRKLQLFELKNSDTFYTDSSETTELLDLNRIQQDFVIIDAAFHDERVEFWEKRCDTIANKYEVWKVISFQDIFTLLCEDRNDKLFEQLDWQNKVPQVKSKPLPWINYKSYKNSMFYETRNNKVSELQDFLWNFRMTRNDKF